MKGVPDAGGETTMSKGSASGVLNPVASVGVVRGDTSSEKVGTPPAPIWYGIEDARWRRKVSSDTLDAIASAENAEAVVQVVVDLFWSNPLYQLFPKALRFGVFEAVISRGDSAVVLSELGARLGWWREPTRWYLR